MKQNSKIKRNWMIISLIGLTMICLFFAVLNRNQNSYKSLPQQNNQTAIETFQKSLDENPPKLNYEFYYNPECKDCQKLEKTDIVKTIKQTKKTKPVMIVNVKALKHHDKQFADKWLIKSQVKNTPTLLVKYNHQIIYSYTGTNKKTIQTLLRGINPKTHNKIKSRNPELTTIDNQETKTYENINVINTN